MGYACSNGRRYRPFLVRPRCECQHLRDGTSARAGENQPGICPGCREKVMRIRGEGIRRHRLAQIPFSGHRFVQRRHEYCQMCLPRQFGNIHLLWGLFSGFSAVSAKFRSCVSVTVSQELSFACITSKYCTFLLGNALVIPPQIKYMGLKASKRHKE